MLRSTATRTSKISRSIRIGSGGNAPSWIAAWRPGACGTRVKTFSKMAPLLRASGRSAVIARRMSSASASWPPYPPATPTADVEGEADGPHMVTTEVPGAASKAAAEELAQLQENGALHFFVDFEKSRGCYLVDADGNTMLDLYGHISSLPLGYNHPAMTAMFAKPENASLLAHRPALANLPPVGWPQRLQESLMSVAPKGLTQVNTLMCGSCSNENAFKLAFMRAARKRRGGALPTAEDYESCMQHEEPGSPRYSILGFEGAFHGRLLGCLSVTHSKALHKVDIPAYDWPSAPFPRLKYPLEDHVEENKAEEARCLAAVDAAIRRAEEKGAPVAGVIVEPIQAEGGDNAASSEFFRGLRALTREHDVALIVDEVQTGGGPTGTFWAHEAWGLEDPPDIVTFSKKLQAAGFFTHEDYRPDLAYRLFNTWMGDPTRLLQLEVVLNTIRDEALLENVRTTGSYLEAGLRDLQARYSSKISSVRGRGTFLAFDVVGGGPARDALVAALRLRGIEIGGCGEETIRLRPPLVFKPKHAAVFLSILDEALADA